MRNSRNSQNFIDQNSQGPQDLKRQSIPLENPVGTHKPDVFHLTLLSLPVRARSLEGSRGPGTPEAPDEPNPELGETGEVRRFRVAFPKTLGYILRIGSFTLSTLRCPEFLYPRWNVGLVGRVLLSEVRMEGRGLLSAVLLSCPTSYGI